MLWDSPCVVDPVVDGLGPPEAVGVVKLEEVDALAWVSVAASVHLLHTVSSINRHNHRERGAVHHLLRGHRTPLHVRRRQTSKLCYSQSGLSYVVTPLHTRVHNYNYYIVSKVKGGKNAMCLFILIGGARMKLILLSSKIIFFKFLSGIIIVKSNF